MSESLTRPCHTFLERVNWHYHRRYTSRGCCSKQRDHHNYVCDPYSSMSHVSFSFFKHVPKIGRRVTECTTTIMSESLTRSSHTFLLWPVYELRITLSFRTWTDCTTTTMSESLTRPCPREPRPVYQLRIALFPGQVSFELGPTAPLQLCMWVLLVHVTLFLGWPKKFQQIGLKCCH